MRELMESLTNLQYLQNFLEAMEMAHFWSPPQRKCL